MPIDFNRLLSRTPREEKISEYKMRLRLAVVDLEYAKEHADKANESLYDALSHLAEIPECKIKLNLYDKLRYDYTLPFDTETFLLVKDKLIFVEKLITTLILEGDDGIAESK